MASHTLAIAKASLAASMIRPDPVSIPRTEIAHFHDLLEAVLVHCSSSNIQLCKDWLLDNIIQSASRISGIAKYLVVLAGSFPNSTDDSKSHSTQVSKSSGRQKQLYILYLLNDLLHHTKYHSDAPSSISILVGNIQSNLDKLIASASAHDIERYPKHHKKIQNLLDIWGYYGYYQSSFVEKLRTTASKAARLGYQPADGESTAGDAARDGSLGEDRKDAPYIMPASHGDISTPFYDLPAANILPHIVPHSMTPINPQLVKPLQFAAGPADEHLVTAVKAFLRDVNSLDEVNFEDESQAMDTNELGQCVMRDEITGDILEGDGYYGWSRAFCERMKRRGAGSGDILKALRQDMNLNRKQNPLKRRYSNTSSSSRSRSRSRGRSSSVRSIRNRHSRNAQSPITRSESMSRGPLRGSKPYRSLRSPSKSMSRSCSYSPPPVIPAEQEPPQAFDPRPLPRDRAYGPSPPQPPAFVPPFPHGIPPLGPGGLPVPPPPPPNYRGPWPPPPPPPPPPMFEPRITDDPRATPPSFPHSSPPSYQYDGPSSFSKGPNNSFPNPASQDPNNWSQMQQQSGAGGSLPFSGRGRGQGPVRGSAQGRGLGPRGWTR